MNEIVTADVLDWAREYDGPLSRTFVALIFGIGKSMAYLTEGNEVTQSVGRAVVGKASERVNMVDLRSVCAATLASAPVTTPRRPSLGLPVGAMPVAAALANILRVQGAKPITVRQARQQNRPAPLRLIQLG